MTGCKESEEQLFTQTKKLTAQMALEHGKPHQIMEDEDLIAEGNIAWVKAYNSYNPKTDMKYSTYLSRCIRNHILTLVRKSKEKMRNDESYANVHLDSPNPNSESRNSMSEYISLCDSHLDFNEMDNRVSCAKVEEVIKMLTNSGKLSKQQETIFTKHIYENTSLYQLGLDSGLTRQNITHHYKKAVKNIQSAYKSIETKTAYMR